MTRLASLGLVTAIALVLCAHVAWADEPKPQYTSQDIVNALAGPPDQPIAQPQGESNASPDNSCAQADADGVCEAAKDDQRGFILPHKTGSSAHGFAPSAVQNTPQAEAAPRTRAAFARPRAAVVRRPFDLRVTFQLGSSELTDQARANIRQFADAMTQPRLATHHFELAGYTDASGAADRNLSLSDARAEAVKAYLLSLNVDATRLDAHGYGAKDYLDPSKPYSPDNRRVVARVSDN